MKKLLERGILKSFDGNKVKTITFLIDNTDRYHVKMLIKCF